MLSNTEKKSKFLFGKHIRWRLWWTLLSHLYVGQASLERLSERREMHGVTSVVCCWRGSCVTLRKA